MEAEVVDSSRGESGSVLDTIYNGGAPGWRNWQTLGT
jgi:hypothetical protein